MSSIVVVPHLRLPEADLSYSEALVDRELALGSTHPVTLLALGNFAHQMVAQEKYTDAEPMLREELAGYTQSVGPNHPNTLQAKLSLARVLAKVGEAEEAKSIVRETAATVDQETLSADSLTQTSVVLLQACASVLQLLEEDGEASRLLRSALNKWRAMGSQGTADAKGVALALCLALDKVSQNAGGVPEMLAEARMAWAAQLVLTEPSTLTLATNLAARLLQPRWITDPMGRIRFEPADCVLADEVLMRELEPLLLQSADTRRAQLGAQNPSTIIAIGNLAVCRFAIGRYAEAEAGFREHMAGLEEIGLPADDPVVHECTVNLGRTLEAVGRLDDARELFAAVAEEAAFLDSTPGSPGLLNRMFDLARCELALGNAAEAEALLQEMHDNCLEELGYQHQSTRVCAYALAQFLQDQDRLEEAEVLLNDFREGSAPGNTAEALEAEAPVCLSVVGSLAGLLRTLRT